MEANRQLANASAFCNEPRLTSGAISQTSHDGHVTSTSGQTSLKGYAWVGAMFGDTPRRKVLCSCGVIADFDSAMVSTKKGLGKVVECRSCRNRRVAREMEELTIEFMGEGSFEGGSEYL